VKDKDAAMVMWGFGGALVALIAGLTGGSWLAEMFGVHEVIWSGLFVGQLACAIPIMIIVYLVPFFLIE